MHTKETLQHFGVGNNNNNDIELTYSLTFICFRIRCRCERNVGRSWFLPPRFLVISLPEYKTASGNI